MMPTISSTTEGAHDTGPARDRHSRIVGFFKVALPLVALGLLSTLFLLSGRIDPSAAIPYANVDVAALLREPRMTQPAFAGVTSDGTAVRITAEIARPATEDRVADAIRPKGHFDMPDGSKAVVTAETVKFDTDTGRVILAGDVRVTTSSGYDVETPFLTVTLDPIIAESTGGVVAAGPPGRIDAEGFTLQAAGESAARDDYLLVFSGRVKMVYQPGG